MKGFISGAVLACLALTAQAGEPAGPHDGAELQIWAYSSAAPAPLGTAAAVLGLDGAILREGTNGWTCMVGNPRQALEGGWGSAHQAMSVCTDDVGMRWMSDFMAGKDPQLESDAFMWLLHGDVGEDNTTAGVLDLTDAKDPS